MTQETVQIVKVGGRTIDDEWRRGRILADFAAIDGPKILVHGGGVAADHLSERLGIVPRKVDGRRITDRASLEVAVMVYAGLLNKSLVAALAARSIDALGVTGADDDLMRAKQRQGGSVDFGFVGDIATVNVAALRDWLARRKVPVVAPITHDGEGQLLNTNGDSIAAALATALAPTHKTRLIMAIDRPGVLAREADSTSLIERLTFAEYQQLLASGAIAGGMLPKLQNGFAALDAGVDEVLICPEEGVKAVSLGGTRGTALCRTS